MREIKFRAWHITSGMATFTMNDLYNFEAEGARKSSVCFQDGDIHKLDDVEVMQSTGLYDKNGKEICEGDILSDQSFVEWCSECVGFRPMFSYDQNHICHYCDGDYGWMDLVDRTGKVLVHVIGNIHENPELLEGK